MKNTVIFATQNLKNWSQVRGVCVSDTAHEIVIYFIIWCVSKEKMQF